MASKKGPKTGSSKKKKPVKRGGAKENEMAERTIPKHKHCNNCGLSIPPDEEFCSESCRGEFDRMVKRKRKWMWLPFIITIALVLFLLLTGGF